MGTNPDDRTSGAYAHQPPVNHHKKCSPVDDLAMKIANAIVAKGIEVEATSKVIVSLASSSANASCTGSVNVNPVKPNLNTPFGSKASIFGQEPRTLVIEFRADNTNAAGHGLNTQFDENKKTGEKRPNNSLDDFVHEDRAMPHSKRARLERNLQQSALGRARNQEVNVGFNMPSVGRGVLGSQDQGSIMAALQARLSRGGEQVSPLQQAKNLPLVIQQNPDLLQAYLSATANTASSLSSQTHVGLGPLLQKNGSPAELLLGKSNAMLNLKQELELLRQIGLYRRLLKESMTQYELLQLCKPGVLEKAALLLQAKKKANSGSAANIVADPCISHDLTPSPSPDENVSG
mmetsp:Transcript_24794/g.38229  ORF Transcript_24794/g.38229 Transcript_24794/m.38229 type:complete len:348 (-) Transcript_24794:576-1619(-)